MSAPHTRPGAAKSVADLPTAVRESSFHIGGLTMRVYHLDDGRRIINADEVAALFEGALAEASQDQLAALANICRGE